MKPAAMALVAALLLCGTVAAQQTGEWAYYGGDAGGSRSSPLHQIDRSNVSRLARAWVFHTGEIPRGRRRSFEATPIMIDGLLYFMTPLGKVIALEPETGREVWRYEAGVNPEARFGDFASRGVSTWLDARKRSGEMCRRRIFAATVDARLIALDAATGVTCVDFGQDGVIDLRLGLRNEPLGPTEYEVTSPPAVINDLVITGSAVADNNRTAAASGEVRAFEARTGALRWTWDPVPQDSTDPAFHSWRGDEAHRTGAANAWSVIAIDLERGLIFVPTSSPSPDYYGGFRQGDNRYANSVVALRAETGDVVWHFQTVHHDLWDYDNAAPPALFEITREGRTIPVVAQATKSGQLFVLHRETGEPVFEVLELPVPASTVPGEHAAETQPFSSIEPLSPQRMTAAQAWGANERDRAYCRALLGSLRNEGPFTPPSMRGTLVLPSNIGGAHWGGLAYDAAREVVVVPVNTVVSTVKLIPEAEFNADSARADGSRTGAEYTRMRGTPYYMRREIPRAPSGMPCSPPPFGLLVAVRMKTGKKVWQVPLGAPVPDPVNTPGTFGLGSPNLGGPIVTAGGLVFIAATRDQYLRAFDVTDGRELWQARLPAGGKATPMTFMGRDGKQYVIIAAGGDGDFFGSSDALIAYRLP